MNFLATYTWSHALDDAFLPLGGIGQSGSAYRNWRQLGYDYDYGPSFFDNRHRVTVNGEYELPFGEGHRYLNHGGLINETAGGWVLDPLFRAQTAQSEVVLPNNDPTNLGNNNTAYAYRRGDPYAAGGTPTSSNSTCAPTWTVATWVNPCSFVNPPQATTTGQTDLRRYGRRSGKPSSDLVTTAWISLRSKLHSGAGDQCSVPRRYLQSSEHPGSGITWQYARERLRADHLRAVRRHWNGWTGF